VVGIELTLLVYGARLIESPEVIVRQFNSHVSESSKDTIMCSTREASGQSTSRSAHSQDCTTPHLPILPSTQPNSRPQMSSISSSQMNSNSGPILTAMQVFESLDQSIDIAQKKGDLNLYESHVTEVSEHGVKVKFAYFQELSA
jgi:hypothetical protein